MLNGRPRAAPAIGLMRNAQETCTLYLSIALSIFFIHHGALS
jgi:hypothetical protein